MSFTPPELECISLQVHGSVALVKLVRPNRGNALNRRAFEVWCNHIYPSLHGAVITLVLTGSCKDLLTAMRWSTENPDIRIIVQTGEGKYFTTGT